MPASDLDVAKMSQTVMREPTLVGRYMFHCHNLEHEDYHLMRPFDVLPAAAGSPAPKSGE
jgi:FtsP/CotA-like multicopper oxidase with cupredoxin domain